MPVERDDTGGAIPEPGATPAARLLAGPVRAVNVGLEGFAQELAGQGIGVVHVRWSPPADGDAYLARLLADLDAAEIGETVATANREAVRRMLAADPWLVDVVPARSVLERLGKRQVLHAGPPVTWERMCGPMRGAVTGIAVFEGWARSLEEAERMAAAGDIAFEPNHRHDCVGPMTGMTTQGQMLMVVENRAFGNRAYCTINEGLGKVMRFGGNDAEVIERIRWLTGSLGPLVGEALRRMGGIPLKPLIARGLAMGDEMHQRNVACSSLLLRQLAPALARVSRNSEDLARALAFIGANDQFHLNVAMAMAKAIMDSVRGIAGSSVVVAMSRNGTDFGIQVSATGSRWFTAPVEMPKGLY
ncbi:MAG: DUF1116 domain-containing protein, partial [Hyphomicrobiaceae bacterium]